MKRLSILGASVLVQLILGRVYAWSGIARSLQADFAYSALQTELIFGFCIAFFAAGTMLTGRLVQRLGPRPMVLIAAALYASAHVLVLLGGNFYLLQFIALGPLSGLAIAFGYVCPLAVAVQWYPRNKGLVTGLAVAGFGAGAMIDSLVSTTLIELGIPTLQRIVYAGLGNSLILALAALPLAFPQKQNTQHHVHNVRLPENHFIKTKLYWGLSLAMFFGTAGGLIVIGKILTIADEFGFSDYGLFAMSLVAIGNAVGRLSWGVLVDKFGSRMLLLSLAISALALTGLAFSAGNIIVFLTSIFLVGVQFGSCLVIFATFTEKYYGPGAIAWVYPFIFVWYGLAALLLPGLSGFLHDLTNSFTPSLVLAAIMPFAGFAALYAGFATISTSRTRAKMLKRGTEDASI